MSEQKSERSEDIREQFFRLAMLMHRYGHHIRREHGLFGDPRRGQGRVLSLLKMQPEISQKDLAYLLDMRPQSLGELLGKLEKNGFITRTPSEKDRRVMIVRLTEEGEKAAAQSESVDDDIFGCLNEEEQEQLSEYLGRLIEALEKKTGEFGEDSRREKFFGFFAGRYECGGEREDGPDFDERDFSEFKDKCGRRHPFHKHFDSR